MRSVPVTFCLGLHETVAGLPTVSLVPSGVSGRLVAEAVADVVLADGEAGEYDEDDDGPPLSDEEPQPARRLPLSRAAARRTTG